jgi:hypothetical protein
MRRSVMTGALLTMGTVLGVLTVVTAADGRSRRSSRRDCLAAFWPPGDAQHCRLLRTSEQHFSRSAAEWAGGGCA